MNLSVDRPDVVAFLATLPADPERDRRADTLRAASRTFAAAIARKQELAARSEQIARDIVDAAGKDREALITERGTIATELTMIPTMVRVVTTRFAEALVAWGIYTYRQVVAEHDAVTDSINASRQQRQHLVTQLTRFESATMWDADAAPLRAEYDELQAKLRPHYQRQSQAADIGSAIEIDIRGRFGEQVRGASVTQEHVDRFVTRVTRAAA